MTGGSYQFSASICFDRRLKYETGIRNSGCINSGGRHTLCYFCHLFLTPFYGRIWLFTLSTAREMQPSFQRNSSDAEKSVKNCTHECSFVRSRAAARKIFELLIFFFFFCIRLSETQEREGISSCDCIPWSQSRAYFFAAS